jgi:hypothetical protein
MSLTPFIGVAPTWGLVFPADGNGDPISGPLASFATEPDITVTVIKPNDIPDGKPTLTRQIDENAQSFDVTYYRFEGYKGLFHHGGKNWILWDEEMKHIFIAHGKEDWARTWVYVRFVLRHFIVGHLMQRPNYRRVHAVAGTLADGQSGILIAGRWLTGKTYLIERLIEQGIVLDLIEDDCAVVDENWILHCLIPNEFEQRATRQLPIRAIVCLDDQDNVIEQIAPHQAAEWAFSLSASWPLHWLPPTIPIETTVPNVPTDLVALRLPAKPAIPEASAAIRDLVS